MFHHYFFMPTGDFISLVSSLKSSSYKILFKIKFRRLYCRLSFSLLNIKVHRTGSKWN